MSIEQVISELGRAQHLSEQQLASKSIIELQQERASTISMLADLNSVSGNDAAHAARFVETELENISRHLRSRQNGLNSEGEHAQRMMNPTAAYESSGLLRPNESVRSYMRANGLIKEGFEELTIGALMRCMVTGPKNSVERRALEEGSDAAGGVTVPLDLLARWIDKLRSALVCVKSGAQTLVLNTEQTTIAKLVNDLNAQWRLESNPIVESEPTFGSVDLVAHSLAVLPIASRELLQDSRNIEQMLESSIINSMAVQLDAACLLGSGSDPEPLGIYNTPNVNNVPQSGPLDSYDPLIDAMALTWENNEPTTSAIIMSPANLAVISELKEGTTNAPLRKPDVLQNVPIYMTTSMDDDKIILGNFAKLIMGIRSQIRIEVLKELFAQTLQYGFLAHCRFDCAVENPKSFSRIVITS